MELNEESGEESSRKRIQGQSGSLIRMCLLMVLRTNLKRSAFSVVF
jgi:hypothetical protein